MSHQQIKEIQRIFLSRLAVLDHLLDVGEKHFPDFTPVLLERLAADMFPLGTQVAFACNQPRGFALWCANQPVEQYPPEVESLEQARTMIADTRQLVSAISCADSKLDEIKRIGLGPGRYCELPGHQYVSEFLMPNFYFHITTAYALLRKLGAPVGKANFMGYLAPYVKMENPA